MNRKKKEEALHMQMFRDLIIKPQQRKRFTEQHGRTKESQSGEYLSPAWKKLRARKAADTPYCEACQRRGRYVSMKYVDHIKPVDLFPELFLCYDNLQSLCEFDHIQKTAADKKERNRHKLLNDGKKLMNELKKGKDPEGGGFK